MLFPFEGGKCHVEVLSTLGVRYQGVLKTVDAGNKSITLTNVHHYGSETRVVEGVAPIPAKGTLPSYEERVIYAIYIRGVRRILPPDEAESGPPPPSPPPPPNNLVHHSSSNGANCVQLQPEAASNRGVECIQCRVDDAQRYSSNLVHHLPSYVNEDWGKQPPPPCEISVAMVREEVIMSDDAMGEGERRMATRGLCFGMATPREGSSKHRQGHCERRGEMSKPVYFIAQHLHIMALGVLLNRDQHPRAPIFVGIYCDGPTVGKHLRLGQKWRLPTHSPESYRSTYPNRSIAPRVHEDGSLGMDAKLGSNREMELVEERRIHRSEGRIIRQWRAYARERNGIMRERIRVQVAAKGAVEGVQLGDRQFGGVYANFLALSEGDRVEVEMVRLDKGCWVGPNYLLPDIYGDASLPRELQGMQVVKARSGDYLPVRIRELPQS